MAHLYSQTFTSNGIFIVPAGIRKIYITGVAAGGGGAGGGNNNGQIAYGGGGGAGQYTIDTQANVISGQSVSIIIGPSGAGGVNQDGNGENDARIGVGYNASNTTVGSLLTLIGGYGGGACWCGHEAGQIEQGLGGGGWPGGNAQYGGISSLSPYGNGGNGGYQFGLGTAGNSGYVKIEWDNPETGNYIIYL